MPVSAWCSRPRGSGRARRCTVVGGAERGGSRCPEHLALDGLPRGNELRVVRAELRAASGDVTGALADFNTVLQTAPRTSGLAERALYGRATCRARTGDREGARLDNEEYLRLIPRDDSASQVRIAAGR